MTSMTAQYLYRIQGLLRLLSLIQLINDSFFFIDLHNSIRSGGHQYNGLSSCELIGTVVGGVCCLEANKALDHEDESESNENDIKEPEPIQPTIMDNFDTIKPLPSTTLPSLHNKSVDLLNTNTNTLSKTLKSLIQTKCSKYRYEIVYYGTIKNRGNFVRLLFEEAGIPYTDISDRNKIMQYVKCNNQLSKSNCENLFIDMFAPPAVIRYPLNGDSNEDIIGISQTAALVLFLSEEFNLRPSTLENFYKAQMLIANSNDILTEIFNHRNDNKKDLDSFFNKRIQIWLDILQKPLTISPNQKYYFDNRCLSVDICVYNICEGIIEIMDKRRQELFIDTHNILYKHYLLIKNRSIIKKYVDKQNKNGITWWPAPYGFKAMCDRLNGREKVPVEKKDDDIKDDINVNVIEKGKDEIMKIGGWGKDANKDEMVAAANAVKQEVEKKAKENGKVIKVYEVLSGKQQVVAGMNYKINIKIGENMFCQIMVYKSLPPISYQLKSITFM